jgi:hypothetical protein
MKWLLPALLLLISCESQVPLRPAGTMVRAGDWIAQAYSDAGFRLRLYSLADPAQKRDVVLAKREEAHQNAKMIGFDGKHIWVYGSTLYGVDPNTLTVIGFDQLNEANPDLAGAWMADSKFGLLDRPTVRLHLTAADGRKFLIDPVTLKAAPVAPAQVARDAADYQRQRDAYDDALDLATAYTADSYYYAGELRSDEEWVGLLSDEEAANQSEYWRLPRRIYPLDQRRKLYRLKLKTTVDDRGVRTRKVLGAERLGQETFFRAGLVRDPSKAKAWRLADPDGYLILHQYRLDSPIVAARVDLSGKKLWEWNLGPEHLRTLYPGGQFLAVVFDQGQLASLDLRSGTLKTLKMP